MLTHIFFDILEMNLAVSAVVLLTAALMPKLDRRYGIGWRKAFWIVIGVRLLIPYNFSWDAHALHLFPLSEEWQLPGVVEVSAAVAISALWFLGLAFCLRHRYLCYRKFRKEIVENSRQSFDEKELSLLQEVLSDIGIKREVTLYHCALVSSPMVLEVLEPMLVLPEETYSEEELRMIFSHEGMHIDNLDIVYKMVMLVVEAVHWFNPLIHKMVKWSYRDVEIFCDQCVVEDMDKAQRGRYGRTILDAVERQRGTDVVFSTCFYGSAGMMRQRVEHLFYMEKKKNGIFLGAALLLLCLLLGIFIKCGV